MNINEHIALLETNAIDEIKQSPNSDEIKRILVDMFNCERKDLFVGLLSTCERLISALATIEEEKALVKEFSEMDLSKMPINHSAKLVSRVRSEIAGVNTIKINSPMYLLQIDIRREFLSGIKTSGIGSPIATPASISDEVGFSDARVDAFGSYAKRSARLVAIKTIVESMDLERAQHYSLESLDKVLNAIVKVAETAQLKCDPSDRFAGARPTGLAEAYSPSESH